MTKHTVEELMAMKGGMIPFEDIPSHHQFDNLIWINRKTPAWQFCDGRPMPRVQSVLYELQCRSVDGVDAMAFFLLPNENLNGAKPIEMLGDGLDEPFIEVIKAAWKYETE